HPRVLTSPAYPLPNPPEPSPICLGQHSKVETGTAEGRKGERSGLPYGHRSTRPSLPFSRFDGGERHAPMSW
ncbi:MAG: hypothetical protein ACJ788_17065, partial [Ktedonobacteraceae bacterium]